MLKNVDTIYLRGGGGWSLNTDNCLQAEREGVKLDAILLTSYVNDHKIASLPRFIIILFNYILSNSFSETNQSILFDIPFCLVYPNLSQGRTVCLVLTTS